MFNNEPEPVIAKIDKEILDFASNLEGALRNTLQGNVMANAIPLIIPVRFTIEDWYGIVARDLQSLKENNPDNFENLMVQNFGLLMERDEAQDGDTLYLELDLCDGEPRPIDYFNGFHGRKGFESLKKACDTYGLDFQLYCAPEDDGVHADIGMTLWSKDNRPLISCVRDLNTASPSRG